MDLIFRFKYNEVARKISLCGHTQGDQQPENPMLRNGNPRGNPNTATRCGAKTRAGAECQSPAIHGKKRCRMHGGKSTGAPCGENHGMYKNGRWTKIAIQQRAEVNALIRQVREFAERF